MRTFVLPTRFTAGIAHRPRPAVGLLKRIALWFEVRRQRRQLLAMNDFMLHDIGLSRADAEGEAMRPFWDLPERWR